MEKIYKSTLLTNFIIFYYVRKRNKEAWLNVGYTIAEWAQHDQWKATEKLRMKDADDRRIMKVVKTSEEETKGICKSL